MQKLVCALDRMVGCQNKVPDPDGFCLTAECCDKRIAHCREHWFISDTADGAEVAALVIGIYLNHSFGHCKEFLQTLLEERPAVRFNFSCMAIAWFLLLGQKQYFDDRNKDSVIFSKIFSSRLREEELPAFKDLNPKSAPSMMDVTFRDGFEVAKAMTAYLNRGDPGYESFLRYSNNEHPTLQQCFARTCCGWFSLLDAEPKKAHEIELKWARQIQCYNPHFRYV